MQKKNGEIKIHYTIEDNAEGTERFRPNGLNIVKTLNGVAGEEEFESITYNGVGEGEKANENKNI